MVLFTEGALTAPPTHRLGSLPGVLRGTLGKMAGGSPAMGNHCGPKENYVSILFSGEVHLSLDAHPSPFWLAGWVPEAKAPEAVAVALPEAVASPEQLLLQPNRLDSADPDRQASGCGGFVMPALSQVWGHRGGGAVQAPHKHLSGVYTHITHTTPPVQTSLAALETSCFPASKPPRSRSEVSFPPHFSL